jgi:ribose 5-phosphate isomerase RpiB
MNSDIIFTGKAIIFKEFIFKSIPYWLSLTFFAGKEQKELI